LRLKVFKLVTDLILLSSEFHNEWHNATNLYNAQLYDTSKPGKVM